MPAAVIRNRADREQFDILSLTEEEREDILELYHVNKGQMRPVMYGRIISEIMNRENPNVLVFGTGRDSDLWYKYTTRQGGRLVILEDTQKWLDYAVEKNPNLEVYKVDYDQKTFNVGNALECLEDGRVNDIRLDVPEELNDIRWDIILIDGPKGHSKGNPGRMKPMEYAARRGGRAMIFVHDALRPVETAYIQHHFANHPKYYIRNFAVIFPWETHHVHTPTF